MAAEDDDKKKMDELWSSLREKEAQQDKQLLEMQSSNNFEIQMNPLEEKANFDKEDRFTYDAVLVFKVGSKDNKIKVRDPETKEVSEVTEEDHFRNCTAEMLKKIERSGIKTDLWYSVQKDEIYCRIGVPEYRLELEADRVDYDLELDQKKCLELGEALGVRLATVTKAKDAPISEDAWLNMFGKYKKLDPKFAYRQELYRRNYTDESDKKSPHYRSLFNSIDRIKLGITIMEADGALGGAEISFSKLIANKQHPLVAFFPLHEIKKREALKAKWFRLSSTFKSPLQEIRDYFGESIAFYFAFLAYYNRALVIPAIAGLAFFIYQLADNTVDADGVPAYSIFVAIWASLFLEFWKRKEAKYRVRWGMTKFLEKEQPRPEFKGTWLPSPIDGRKVETFPFIKRVVRMIFSQSVIWTLIGVVIACVIGIFFFRRALKGNIDPSAGNIITSIVNAIQIQILNYIYGQVSRNLNDYENHRTDTEYQNNLIAKSFLFKFVNSYNTLFYIAFIKKYDDSVGGCVAGDCLAELRLQLATIFITSIIVNNSLEVFVPMIKTKLADRANRQEVAGAPAGAKVFAEKSIPEKEFELEPYDSTVDDFDELVVQYGFVTLFVVAFPAAPLLALINNVFETRIDSFKVCTLTRRPEPRGCANIGTWFDILNIVSFIAVLTNVGIVCFATDLMGEWVNGDNAARAYVFIIAEHLILLLKFAIAYFVPDEPQDYVNHVMRQEYLVNVLIGGLEEEPEEVVLDNDEAVKQPVVEYDWTRVSDNLQMNTGHEQ